MRKFVFRKIMNECFSSCSVMLLSQLFTILVTAIVAYYAPAAVHKGNALIAHVTARAVSLLPKQIEYVDRPWSRSSSDQS